MKTFFKVTPHFYIIALIMLLTGSFKPFLFIIMLIIAHESGHILMAKLLGYKVIDITIFPFGALTKLNIKLNDPIIKELLIALAGPLFQIIGYKLLKNYFDFYQIHKFLLFYNLLPIYPLDGSKILSNLLYLLMPYNSSTNIIIYVSAITIIFFCTYYIFNFQLIYIIAFSLLINKTYKLYKKKKYLFNLFLLERTMYKFKYPFRRKIKTVFNMYKSTYHRIYNGKYYEEENKYLNKRYKTSIYN